MCLAKQHEEKQRRGAARSLFPTKFNQHPLPASTPARHHRRELPTYSAAGTWSSPIAESSFHSSPSRSVCLAHREYFIPTSRPVQQAHFTHPWNADSHTLHLSPHPLSVQSLRAPPVPARASPSPFPAAWAAPPGHRESLSTPPVRASMLCHSRAVATSLERVTSPLRSPDSEARCGGLSSCRRQDKKKNVTWSIAP